MARITAPVVAAFALSGCVTFAWSQPTADPQARVFSEQFQALCLQSLGQGKAPRQRLRETPGVRTLDAEQARPFLQGRSGQAWWVPDPDGSDGVTLALVDADSRCLLYRRMAPTQAVEAAFQRLASQPPAPLQARPMADQTRPDTPSGRQRMLGYVWHLPSGVPHQVLFLTTVERLDAGAPAQVFASALQLPALGSPRASTPTRLP